MTPLVQLGDPGLPNLDTVQGCDVSAVDCGATAGVVAGDSRFPASFAQQRMWLLDRLLPTSVYIEPKVYRLRGALRVEALQWALDELVERHESLRTRFGFEESGPVQVIAARLRVELAVEDLTGLAAGEREGEARRRAQEEAQTPFDLERAPLLRARLLRVHEQEHWLLLTLHHIITDGWSSGVLARELSELYGAHCRGEASGLPGLPVQYADYAVWQREWLQGEVLEQQLAYWKPALAGLPALELPTDRPRPPMASLPRRRIRIRARARDRTGAAQAGSARGRDVVHDAARGVSGAAVPLQRAGRRRGGRAHCRSHAPRARGLDRVLRQHAGAARGPLGGPELHRVSGAGALAGAGGVRAPGPAVREAGRGAASEARSVAQSAVPGLADAAQRARQRSRAHGTLGGAPRKRRAREREIRPVRCVRRARTRPPRAGRVCDRSVRSRDHRADDGPLAGAARGDRRGSCAVDLAADAVDAAGAPAARRAVERDGGRYAAALRARALRGAGRTHAAGDRGDDGGGAVDVCGAQCAGEPSRALPAHAGSRSRRTGRLVRGALAGAGGRAPGNLEGGRGVRAARSELSGAAACVHDGGGRARRCC